MNYYRTLKDNGWVVGDITNTPVLNRDCATVCIEKNRAKFYITKYMNLNESVSSDRSEDDEKFINLFFSSEIALEHPKMCIWGGFYTIEIIPYFTSDKELFVETLLFGKSEKSVTIIVAYKNEYGLVNDAKYTRFVARFYWENEPKVEFVPDDVLSTYHGKIMFSCFSRLFDFHTMTFKGSIEDEILNEIKSDSVDIPEIVFKEGLQFGGWEMIGFINAPKSKQFPRNRFCFRDKSGNARMNILSTKRENGRFIELLERATTHPEGLSNLSQNWITCGFLVDDDLIIKINTKLDAIIDPIIGQQYQRWMYVEIKKRALNVLPGEENHDRLLSIVEQCVDFPSATVDRQLFLSLIDMI